MTDSIRKASVLFNKQLSHGKPFIAGDQITYGDFAMFAFYCTFCFNSNAKRPEYNERNREALEGLEYLNAWMTFMLTTFEDYLLARPACSL